MTIAKASHLRVLYLLSTSLCANVSADVPCTAEDLSSVAVRPNIDFNTSIQPIINTNCGSCHNFRNLGGLDMDPGVAVANLVDVPSSTTTAGIPRITPLNLDKSFLFKKINCTDLSLTYGFHMPEAFEPGLPPPPALSKEDQAAFRDWILQGARATAAPSIKLGGYLSGNWFIPSQGGGHGFQLEFTDAPGSTAGALQVIAIWFAYTPIPSTLNDGSGQNWIYSQGDYDPASNTVTAPAVLLTGAGFPFPATNFNPNDIRRVSGDSSSLWGSLTFTFSDCDHGTVSWTSTLSAYGSSTPLAIQRLTKIAGTTCPQ